MKKLACASAAAALTIALAACDYNENEAAYDNGANAAYAEGEGGNYADGAGGNYAAGGTAAAAGEWPAGTRIVVEEGVTYRIDPSGTRVRLGPNESRVVVEDGVRFRVDPDGTRVRIDESGVEIGTDTDVDADARAGANVNASADVTTNR